MKLKSLMKVQKNYQPQLKLFWKLWRLETCGKLFFGKYLYKHVPTNMA